ncbi:MAG: hypothetical protein V1659_04445 [Candidatus Woesearchaeota archaeon]
MIESLNEAIEEFKRADHLVYVSLKYTRTVDVILNTINRMVDCYERLVSAMLLYAKETGILKEEMPASPLERGELVKKIFPEEKTQQNIELYFLLRKLSKSKPQRENEFRKHLTMRTVVNGKEEIVNIGIITAYYNFQKEFLDYVRVMILKHAGQLPEDHE